MSRKKMEENNLSLDLDNNILNTVPTAEMMSFIKEDKENKEEENKPSELINCLKNERVVVRHIPKETGIVHNPKHILYGGMAENATRTYVVPRLSSGMFVNVLTDNEKKYLEHIMGLEYNTLSIYKKHDNFWDDSNDKGINKVRLRKQDNYFNLADPEDYIKYKILLANKDFIAPSLKALQDMPKATYQFVIIEEGEEDRRAQDNMSTTMKCYKEFGKVENDRDILRLIVETLEGKPTSSNVKIEFLHNKINTLIQTNSKLFLKVISDPLLKYKVIIKKGIEAGLIANRGNYLYLKSDNTPLCEDGENPTFSVAAKYLASPKRQEVLFSIQAHLK